MDDDEMKTFMLTNLPVGTIVTTATSQMLYLNHGKRFVDGDGKERFGKGSSRPRKGDVERWRGRARGEIVSVSQSMWTHYDVRHDDGKVLHYTHCDIDSWEEPEPVQTESVSQRSLPARKKA
jgi:hypothetical protein